MRLQGHQQHNNNYKSASISTEQDYAELCAALRRASPYSFFNYHYANLWVTKLQMI